MPTTYWRGKVGRGLSSKVPNSSSKKKKELPQKYGLKKKKAKVTRRKTHGRAKKHSDERRLFGNEAVSDDGLLHKVEGRQWHSRTAHCVQRGK